MAEQEKEPAEVYAYELFNAFPQYQALRNRYSEPTLIDMMGDEYTDLQTKICTALREYLKEFLRRIYDKPRAEEVRPQIEALVQDSLYFSRIKTAAIVEMDLNKALNVIAEAYNRALDIYWEAFKKGISVVMGNIYSKDLDMIWDDDMGLWRKSDFSDSFSFMPYRREES